MKVHEARSLLLQRLSQYSHIQDLGLYIHIPFCKKRCHFCAFYLTTHRESRVQEFLSALFQEIVLYAQQGSCDRFPVSTIYFGGGTPTSLRSEQLMAIIGCIRQHFSVSPSLEVTVEADPGTVSLASLQTLYDAGVNRLSFGVQSLEGSEWKQLGRSGELHMVGSAIKMAKDIGFSNIGIDLIYGLPGQTLKSWERSLEQVQALQATHVSCYALTIEEGTRFHRDLEQGIMNQSNLLLEAAMHDHATTSLQSMGYLQYEVSNFAQPGFECQHNLRYWSGLEYLGFGPSAQSYMAHMRFGNVADLVDYSKSFDREELPVDIVDSLTVDEMRREQVVFGLRLNQGVPMIVVQQLEEDVMWSATLQKVIDLGLLIRDHKYLKTTAMGRQHMDTVALQLM